MPKVTKICKTCGKEYEACHTPNPGIFRWRDVACSPECAAEYFRAVEIARGNIVEEQPAVEVPEVVAEPAVEPEESGETIAEDPQAFDAGEQVDFFVNTSKRRKK